MTSHLKVYPENWLGQKDEVTGGVSVFFLSAISSHLQPTSSGQPTRDAGGREPSPVIGRRASPFPRSWERVFPVSCFCLGFISSELCAPPLSDVEASGRDWTQLPPLHFFHLSQSDSAFCLHAAPLTDQESGRAVLKKASNMWAERPQTEQVGGVSLPWKGLRQRDGLGRGGGEVR